MNCVSPVFSSHSLSEWCLCCFKFKDQTSSATPLNQGAFFCRQTLRRIAGAWSSRAPVSTESRSSAFGARQVGETSRQVCFQGSAVDGADISRHDVCRPGRRNRKEEGGTVMLRWQMTWAWSEAMEWDTEVDCTRWLSDACSSQSRMCPLSWGGWLTAWVRLKVVRRSITLEVVGFREMS